MTDLEKIISLAKEQIGVCESGENNVIYNTHYYNRKVQGPQYPWCMAFVWDMFRMAGLSKLFLDGEKSAYCPYVMEWAQKHGRWTRGEYAAGDIMLYDWDGDGVADHTGICLSDSGETVRAIEGNVSDGVKEVIRWKSHVLGAYRPNYDNTAAEDSTKYDTTLPTVKRGDVSGAVLSVQILLIHKWAISCGPDGADADFGPNTEAAAKAFQRHIGLEETGVVGPATWASLIK